jgi:23S rRNA pseudouridine1911/1915/1917 synthase
VVPPAGDGLELLAWLTQRFTYFDGNGWRTQIDAGRVQVGERVTSTTTVVRTGDEVAFFPAEQRDAAAEVPVLFADDDLVVVDKPPFLVVQHTGAFLRHTFVRGLSERFAPVPPRTVLEPVHRLDRETSGVLVLARSERAASSLQQQFEAGTVGKEYLALVHGVVVTDSVVVDAPIGKSPHSAIAARHAVVATGSRGARAAVTEFTVVRRFAAHTLLRVVPHTGRTHQIRVHLEHLGHPLVGDKMYGHPDAHWLAYTAHLKADGDPRWPGHAAAPRQMLHAATLRCAHPGTSAPLELTAPLPADFLAAVNAAATDT